MATSTENSSSAVPSPPSDNPAATNSTGQQVVEGNEQQEAAAAPQRPGGWQMLKTFAFQLLIFYLITSWFKGGKEAPTSPDGTPLGAAVNVFNYGQTMVSMCGSRCGLL